MLKTSNVMRAVLAGVIATIVMTALMSAGPLIGVHTWDIGAMIGSAMSFGRTVTPSDPLWMWGMAVHFLFGMCVFPLIYAHWTWGWMRGPNWMRGLCWGLFLWFMTQALFMPLVGEGFFDMGGPNPLLEVFSWLILLVIYSIVFGMLAGPQEVRRLELQDHPDWVAH